MCRSQCRAYANCGSLARLISVNQHTHQCHSQTHANAIYPRRITHEPVDPQRRRPRFRKPGEPQASEWRDRVLCSGSGGDADAVATSALKPPFGSDDARPPKRKSSSEVRSRPGDGDRIGVAVAQRRDDDDDKGVEDGRDDDTDGQSMVHITRGCGGGRRLTFKCYQRNAYSRPRSNRTEHCDAKPKARAREKQLLQFAPLVDGKLMAAALRPAVHTERTHAHMHTRTGTHAFLCDRRSSRAHV